MAVKPGLIRWESPFEIKESHDIVVQAITTSDKEKEKSPGT